MHEPRDLTELCTVAAEMLGLVGRVDYLALARGEQGRWVATASTGPGRPLPETLLADVLDREQCLADGRWLAAPLGPGEAVVAACDGSTDEPKRIVDSLDGMAPLLAAAVEATRDRRRQRAHTERLEAILRIAAQWSRSRQLVPLLNAMAEAATRLLAADRASIFLWDRAHHVLVGRPALGVEGGELRVADDRGVVAEVVRTAQPRRVDAAAEPEAVDRTVDQQTGYQTRNLLCVPLVVGGGRTIGAFEVLNKRAGPFTAEDEAALVELATHAAAALENTRDREQLIAAHRQMTDQAAAEARMIGESPAIDALRSIIHRVADTDLAVLILGENGTGKEVAARSIHYQGGRRGQPFVAVNCA
ncbi:MAG: GAF domain-containing protein, partial [Pirellulales bacterium]